MAGISCFPWNGGNCSVHDMVIFFFDSWLSDFHIDFTLQNISHNYGDHYGAEASDQHVLLPVFDINSIVSAYGSHQKHGRAVEKSKNLLEVESRIILGQVDSVGGVLYLPGHWTSLVITFKQPGILYGDSLRNPMPFDKALSFQRWIVHMLSQSGTKVQESQISISPLGIATQRDSNSCGLFALNAISHHYLQQKSPLLHSNPQSLRSYRMEIALGLLQKDAVSTLLNANFVIGIELMILNRLQATTQIYHLPSPIFHLLLSSNHSQKDYLYYRQLTFPSSTSLGTPPATFQQTSPAVLWLKIP